MDLRTVPAPGGVEALLAGGLRLFLRTCFRSLMGPPFTARAQRRVVALLSLLMPGVGGVLRSRDQAQGVPYEVVAPRHGDHGGAILYLHGGAFCLGSPSTHRSITTRLALGTGMPVFVPDYRLAPEHPYPAALEDVLGCYVALRNRGFGAERIVLAGDSAGGALALSLALTLRDRGEPTAAGLMLISPVTDPQLQGASLTTLRHIDPMLRQGWLEQGLGWYQGGASGPLKADLRGLPPMLIQVGDEEILRSDATRLAERAETHGVPCQLEIHEKRWHVFHLQAFYLRTARQALHTLANFAWARVAANS